MAISYERFLNWAESRFGDVSAKGSEIKLNSIFTEDYKHHMWCSPSGGKNKRPNGVFRCWKTNKFGSLVTLVRLVDKCSYEEAVETLGGDSVVGDLNERIEQFYSQIQKEKELEIAKIGLKLPENTFPISSLPESHIWRVESEFYLLNRKLSPENFLVCAAGDYKNRIVIPYVDKDNVLIYFNARLMLDNSKIPKYMGPDKDCGIGKSNVIYMAGGKWPQNGEKIYLTEGEFDSETLFVCELNAAAIGGKEIYDKQIDYIKDYIPVICVDTDKAGDKALLDIGDKLISKGFKKIHYVRPPSAYKDWNEMLVKTSTNLIRAYIAKNEKLYDENTSIKLRLNRL